jgi:hypothetical protein
MRRKPAMDALERRELLSADTHALVPLTLSSATPMSPAALTLHVSRSGFTFHDDKVLLSLAILGPAGSSGPITMSLRAKKGRSDQIVSEKYVPSGEVMTVRLGPGNYVVEAEDPSVPGPMQMTMSMVGDANGNGRVTASDLRLMRAQMGKLSGGHTSAERAAAKADAREMAMARSNLGAVMKVQPLELTAGLDPSSNPDGNGIVTSPNVVISGQTEPGATVMLGQGKTGAFTQTTTADAQGHYQFSVSVGIGMTPFRVRSDFHGQKVTADTTITRGDVVVAWNQTMLEAIRMSMDTLGLSTRTMAMVQEATYDAVNAIDHFGSVFQVSVPASESQGASPEAAASEAAFDVLSALIPQEQSLFNVTLAESLADIPAGPALNAGIAVGDTVAAGILAWRANDGSNAQVPYEPGTAPGQWRPTPPDYTTAWGPEWGQVTPFAIPNAKLFMPGPPPALKSVAYANAVNLTKSLGAKNSTTRTPQETKIADFWSYDVLGMGPPPVLYNQITQEIALEQRNTLDQNARLFGLVGTAIGDAGIVAWDAKFTYNLWRPIMAIRDANQDGNKLTVADPNWAPMGAPGDGVRADFTPSFPAYASGHATFGAAIFTVLADFYGTDHMAFTIGSDQMPGMDQTFHSFGSAAHLNGISRIYMGVHYIFDMTAGLSSGGEVGNYEYQHVMTLNG